MKNKISTFKKEKHEIITFVGRKFGFYLSLDFEENPKFGIYSDIRLQRI
jgi:hypothetical protein